MQPATEKPTRRKLGWGTVQSFYIASPPFKRIFLGVPRAARRGEPSRVATFPPDEDGWRAQGVECVVRARKVYNSADAWRFEHIGFRASALVIGGCGTQSNEEKPIAKSLVNEPDQVMTNSEIFLMNGSRRAAAVKSDLLKAYTRIDTTLLYVVEVRFFDSAGVQTSLLTADSGRVSRQTNMMSVAGHVKAHTNDNRRLVSDSLRWDAKNDRVVTEGYVEIYRGEDKLTGYGLETDQRFGKVLIKRNLKGSFSEPGE